MKFTVKNKTTLDVTVEFEDGTTAVFPVTKSMDQDAIKAAAKGWNNQQVPYDSVSDVPVDIGTEYETPEIDNDRQVDYRSARRPNYPDMGRQLDALYWARQGDDTKSTSMDAEIKLVKDTITKDKTYKYSEIENLMD